MVRHYNAYVNRYPYEKINYYCNSKLKSKIETRQPFKLANLKRKFPERYFLDLYTKIRNMEEGKPYSDTKIKQIIEVAANYEKVFDINKSLRYINEGFRKNMKNKDGGINSILRNLEQKNKSQNQY